MKDFTVYCISQVLLHKNQPRNLSGMQQEALLSQYTVFKVKVQDIPTAQAVLGPSTETLVQATFPYVCGDKPAPVGSVGVLNALGCPALYAF